MDELDVLLNMMRPTTLFLSFLLIFITGASAETPWAGEWKAKAEQQSKILQDADKGYDYYCSGELTLFLGASSSVTLVKDNYTFQTLQVLFKDKEKWVFFTTSAKEENQSLFKYYPKNDTLITDAWISGTRYELVYSRITKAEQISAGQPATRPESKSEGGDKPQTDAEGRSR